MIRRQRLSLSSEQDTKGGDVAVAEEKNTKKNSDRVQRAYYLDRDIDKALRRMSLENEKNLTETINDILRKGLEHFL